VLGKKRALIQKVHQNVHFFSSAKAEIASESKMKSREICHAMTLSMDNHGGVFVGRCRTGTTVGYRDIRRK